MTYNVFMIAMYTAEQRKDKMREAEEDRLIQMAKRPSAAGRLQTSMVSMLRILATMMAAPLGLR